MHRPRKRGRVIGKELALPLATGTLPSRQTVGALGLEAERSVGHRLIAQMELVSPLARRKLIITSRRCGRRGGGTRRRFSLFL